MEMMRWYNPLRVEEDEVSASMSGAQAIELLSGHRDSDRFIEEYRIRHAMQTDREPLWVDPLVSRPEPELPSRRLSQTTGR
jgi:hypothetical protein